MKPKRSITGYNFSVTGRFLALENKTKINNLKGEKCSQIIPLLIFLIWPMMKLGRQNMQNICPANENFAIKIFVFRK